MPKTRTPPTLTELDALREHAIETLNQATETEQAVRSQLARATTATREIERVRDAIAQSETAIEGRIGAIIDDVNDLLGSLHALVDQARQQAAEQQRTVEQAARQYLERLDVGDVDPAPPEQPVPPAVAARVTDASEPQDPPLP